MFDGVSKIYFDANIMIYFVEHNDNLQIKINDFIESALKQNIILVISYVGIAECLYGVYKIKSDLLEQKYNEMFYDSALFDLVPVTSERVIAASKIGAENGLKLIDALHFSTAIETGCALFVTNDKRFKSTPSLKVINFS